MTYRLKYSDYITTASGPPDPERWVGPPGPMGPPGPQGIPGPMPSGGPFLPLSGGTVTGLLKGPTGQFKYLDIANNANGQGVFDNSVPLSLHYNPTFSTSGGAALYSNVDAVGSITSGQASYHTISINSDSVNTTTGGSAPGGLSWFHVSGNVSTGATGNRTGIIGLVNVAGTSSNTFGSGGYFVALAGLATQTINDQTPVFGANILAQVNAGVTVSQGPLACEFDVGSAAGTNPRAKKGIEVVTLALDGATGTLGTDHAIGIVAQPNGTTTGWPMGLQFGDYYGWWPMAATSTLIGTHAGNIPGGLAMAAAWGIDFSAVTFSGGTIRGPGFQVNGSGIVTAASVQCGTTAGPTWTTGSAAPAAVAPVGSLYSRTGGAVGATLYVSRGGGTWAAVAGV